MAAWFSDKDNADTWQRGSRTRITLTHGSVVLADNRYFVSDSIFLIRHRDDTDIHPAIFQCSVVYNELVFDNKRHATQRTTHTCKPALEAIRWHRRPRHRRGAYRSAPDFCSLARSFFARLGGADIFLGRVYETVPVFVPEADEARHGVTWRHSVRDGTENWAQLE